MNELIALLRQEQDIKEMIEQEKIKQERLEKTYHEQNISIYKNNYLMQERKNKLTQLYVQQETYESAEKQFQKKDLYFTLLFLFMNLIMVITFFISNMGLTIAYIFILIDLLQIPIFQLYTHKEKKIISQCDIQELRHHIAILERDEYTMRLQQIDAELEKDILLKTLNDSKKRLTQLNEALTRIEDKKNTIIFSAEYEETIQPEEKTYQKRISKF